MKQVNVDMMEHIIRARWKSMAELNIDHAFNERYVHKNDTKKNERNDKQKHAKW